MMLLSMKTYLALIWGMSALFSAESMSTSTLETSDVNSTAEPDVTTKQLISPHVVHDETESGPTHRPAETSAAATVETMLSPTVETEQAVVTDRSDSSDGRTTALVAMTTVAATSSSQPQLIHTTTAATTAAGEEQPSHSPTISETADITPTDVLPTAPATSSAVTSAAASSPQLPCTTEPAVTFTLSSTTSPADSTQTAVFIQNLTSPSASTTSTMTADPTSETAPVFFPTSLPVTMSETSTTSTELSSTSQPVSVTRTHIATSRFPDTAGSSSTAEPPATSFTTDSATSTTAVVSTSPEGTLLPGVPKRLGMTKSTPSTTVAPCEVSKSPHNSKGLPCSNRSVMKHCLIAIASLAGLATIFMVSTIILCVKLSMRKYKVKKPKQDTEMMCISALLPERNYTHERHRSRVPNGVLVIHGAADSDEEGGDNLTLSSFLPENDRFV